ncbi:MAG: bifunctional (p)ppGpp synthetase/guanosine-3',5'-bis(diphosphate) 3'-pyrophosphohydrolase, partial [Alphaproteobacteria bacterium]
LYPDIAEPQPSQTPAGPVEGPMIMGLGAGQTGRFGRCCDPLPGERVVGIVQKGRGVEIHAIDCPALVAYEDQPERWLDLRWNPEAGRNPVNSSAIELALANDPGALGRVCTLIGELGANISNIDFTERKPDFYRIRVELELRDVKHLNHIIRALEAESSVAVVSRLRERMGQKAAE